MAYGILKVDNITFDQGGADQTVTVSGIYRAITSGVTVTGTISGAVLIGTTVSGATVTGTTVNAVTVSSTTGTFGSITGTTITGTTINGATVNSTTGNFTSLTGVTVTGTTAQFASGVFITQVSGLTVTGTQSSFTSGNFVTLSGATATFTSGVFTTQVSGTTVTGDTGQFTSGTFVSLTGTTITGTTINAVTVSSTTGTFGSITGTTITGTTINGATVNSTTGNFTSLTGVTVTGTTAQFASGVFITQVSGLTVTGTQSSFTSGNFVTLSGATATFTSGVFTTQVSGVTVTGTTANFTSGNFSNIISSAATMSGALIMANQQQVRFREAVGNGVNHIALQAPAIVSADQTITLPDQTGTVVTTGDNGSVTSTMILDGTILNADINASAAIADTKLDTISTAGKVSGTAITSGAMVTSGSIEIVNTSPAFRLTESDGTSTHSQTLLFRNADQFSIRTSDSAGVALSSDYLIPADASGATDHIWQIADTEKARLTSTGLKTLAADTAADPGYAWQGDEDTGMFRTGANSLGFAAGGLEVLRVNRAGGGGGTTRQIEFFGAGVISTTTGNLTITPEATLALEPQTGVVRSVVIYNSTTASAANIFVNSNGNISRSTSSIKYKTEIEDAELSYSETLIYGSRPVWYRSLSENDPSEYSYWGFIAEEVAEIDPRMVHWGDDGPESVQYDRYVVHLVSVIQKQQQRLDVLEARIAALEA